MIERRTILVAGAAVMAFSSADPAVAQTPNKVAGTWQIVAATVEMNGTTSHPYGLSLQDCVVFTSDMYFVEFLHDPQIPRFKSNERGGGTDEENRAVMAGTLALYGRYSVDADGNFSGNTVEGSSFPNWIGDVRTTNELTMRVEGDRMIENFQRLGGARVTIIFERAR